MSTVVGHERRGCYLTWHPRPERTAGAFGRCGRPRRRADQHVSAGSAVRHVGVAHQPLRRVRSQRFSWRAKVVMHLALVYHTKRPDRCTFQRQQMNAGGAVHERLFAGTIWVSDEQPALERTLSWQFHENLGVDGSPVLCPVCGHKNVAP
jgi:hypothetical protein